MKAAQKRWTSLVAASVGLMTLVGCGGGGSVAPTTPGFGGSNQVAATGNNQGSVTFESANKFRSDGVSASTVIVNLKPGSISAIGTLSKSFSVRTTMAPIGSAVLEVPAGQTPEQFLATLKNDPRFESVELNKKIVLERPLPGRTPFERMIEDATINDPMFNKQYGLAKVNAERAWAIQPGSAKVIIALTDTGVDLNHPDLKDKLLPGGNTAEPGQPAQDDDGHGSHTAGIAAAATNNGVGVAGLGNKCMILPVKVLSGGGGSLATIAEGVIWAADHGAKVLSMSLGIYQRSPVVEKALDYALKKDVVITASAGNNGSENDPIKAPHLPSTHPGVVEVAATDANDKKASFSNFGKTVSVAAPGVDILSTIPVSQGSYGSMSGTSMAAPHAAGLAGLIRSAHPDWNREQVKKWMEQSANKLGGTGFSPLYGHGRIDAFAAVSK